MIVLSLLILFTLTLLGMTSLMNATIEGKISTNEKMANQSLYAADAGINHGLTVLNITGGESVTPNYTDANWSYPADSDGDRDTKTDSDYVNNNLTLSNRYRWFMQFKLDAEDQDTDGDITELVYYNKTYGYPSARYSGVGADNGFPIIEVVSDGIVESHTVSDAGVISSTVGQSERRVVLELGRDKYNVKVEGAITSRSDVDITGTFRTDGNGHNINGEDCDTNPDPPCICATDMPGVFVDTAKVIDVNKPGNLTGNPPQQVNPDARPLPKFPWEALGLAEADMPAPISPASVVEPTSGFIWVAGDLSMDNGEGIVVVHNINFNPDVWNVSNPLSPNYNTSSPDYKAEADSGSGVYDPTYSPAKFASHGNGTFRGIIIADMIDSINGTTNFYGAVLSLTTIEAGHFGEGTAEISYSCDAISQFADMGYTRKLIWRKY